MALEFWVRFRSIGFRWPLRPADEFEVWDGHQQLAILPGSLIILALQHQMTQAELTSMILTNRKPLAKMNRMKPRELTGKQRKIRSE